MQNTQTNEHCTEVNVQKTSQHSDSQKNKNTPPGPDYYKSRKDNKFANIGDFFNK